MTDKPLAHMVTVDATGLQETAPVTNDDSEFADTPTALDITRATQSTPLYARVTARLEPASDAGGGDVSLGAASVGTADGSEGAVRVALTDSSGDATEYTGTATVSDGTGIRTTGWARVAPTFNGGTARLQVANARVTVATLELAVQNDI